MDENKLKFENKNNFQLIMIKPNSISHIDFNSTNYTNELIKLDIYENIICNSENFTEIILEKLLLKKYNQVETILVSEMPNYIYEILYVPNLSTEEVNELGTLINTNDEKIYGNALLMKTYIPTLSNSIIIEDCIVENIKDILDSRVNTNIVIYDSEWSNKIVVGNLENFAEEFFDDKYFKLEIPFLLHNINIWYELCDGCSNNLCGTLLVKPIYKCFWFTMITDEYRGNLFLDEVQKIIYLSNKIEFPYSAKKEWLEDEDDEYGRKIIKNKYKILDLANNFFSQYK